VGTDKRERQKANRQMARIEAEKRAKAAKRKRNIIRWGAIGLTAAVAIILLSVLTKKDSKSPAADATTTTVAADASTTAATGPTTTSAVVQAPFVYGTGECPKADGSSPATKTFTVAPKLCIDPAKAYSATMETSQGTIKIVLDTTRVPGTTNNFVTLARYHYYDDTVLFRTNTGIDIIQGGGKTNTDGPGYTIPDEGGKFSYTEGDFVMARTGAPNSAGGQFFFASGPKTSQLDGQGTYVTFGKVSEGMDVVKKIMALHKDAASGGGDGAPSTTVTVKTITITET
jgi:cyclophilin family peptidyl-prolyl cis-trans isomerase